MTESLEAQRLSVFRDVDTLVAGEEFSHGIAEAISSADAVVVLLSGHSKRSKWVERELESALELEKIVVPILLDADAKNNWIWPLVSDRVTVTVDDTTDYGTLAKRLREVITRGGRKPSHARENVDIHAGGAIVNIQSASTHVTESVGIAKSLGPELQKELQTLLAELQAALEMVPFDRQEDAERLVKATEMVVSEGAKDSPNTSFLKIASEGLNEAAKAVADIVPKVVSIVGRIVTLLTSKV